MRTPSSTEQRDRINATAATHGYRLPTLEERKAFMAKEHAKMADLFARVGNTDMAVQARAARRDA